MIDIYRFINSKSIADYLHSINREFTTSQAAYLVHKCNNATLAEKIEAWRAIVSEMPDERLIVRKEQKNAHDLINKHVVNKESELQKFLNESNAAYFPYESRWGKKPKWVNESWFIKNGLWNTLTMPVPFSTFDKCKEYLRHQEDVLENGWRLDSFRKELEDAILSLDSENGLCRDTLHKDTTEQVHYDRHVVCRVEIDKGWYCSYRHNNDPEPQFTPLDYVVLNGNFEIMDVTWSWNNMDFDYIVPAIPIPFNQGDIVIDYSARVPHPFVFAFAIPWTRCSNGFTYVNEEELRTLLHKERKNLFRSSDMNFTQYYDCNMLAFGYEVDLESSLISIDTFGACRNYLNLEYYDKPLNGELKPLAIVSKFLKGALDFGEAANFNRCAAFDNLFKAILR
jgi:uncharacterized protein (DUF1330 family)